MRGVNASMAAKGMGLSGAGIKGATEFGQGMGSQEYNNAFNRYVTGFNANTGERNQLYNRYAGVAGTGQQAVGSVTAQGANMAGNIGNAYMTSAANTGNAAMAAAGQRQSAFGGAANVLGRMYGPQQRVLKPPRGGRRIRLRVYIVSTICQGYIDPRLREIMAELNFGLLTPPGSQSIGNAFVQGMDQAAVARAQENQNALAQYTLSKAKREDEQQNKLYQAVQDPNFKLDVRTALQYGPQGMAALKAQQDAAVAEQTRALNQSQIAERQARLPGYVAEAFDKQMKPFSSAAYNSKNVGEGIASV
jgi:hypothetical protein